MHKDCKIIQNTGLRTVAYYSQPKAITNYVMISIDDFKVASFEKKCELVTNQTNYLSSRTDDEKKVYLYHTGKFFIEVFYSPLFRRVLLIRAFNDSDSLAPYVETVSLDDLIS